MKVILKGRLNVTSASFVFCSFILTLFLPLIIYIFLNDYVEKTQGSLMTVILPTAVNMFFIPAFKIISLYQNVDKALVDEKKESIERLNEKQIVYTEAVLMVASSVPVLLWYVNIGYNYFPKTYILIYLFSMLFSMLIIGIFSCYIIFLLIKKIREILKKRKEDNKAKNNAEK
ncbi:hypothetical protein [Staphylococcus equorum]|uniref:hypothetical protein n=1 Tax=Staphylococcus equorum TaxID=246432 RepID=UPI0021BF70F9|nr:hypothetical protein [Staphylococcus equorum]